MYIDDILEDTSPIPLPDSPYWQCRCDFGIGDSKTVYARLNEKHEVDGICIVPESEDMDGAIEKNIFSHKNVERVEKEKSE